MYVHPYTRCIRAETMNAMRSKQMESYRKPGYCITVLGLCTVFIGIPLITISSSSNKTAGISIDVYINIDIYGDPRILNN